MERAVVAQLGCCGRLVPGRLLLEPSVLPDWAVYPAPPGNPGSSAMQTGLAQCGNIACRYLLGGATPRFCEILCLSKTIYPYKDDRSCRPTEEVCAQPYYLNFLAEFVVLFYFVHESCECLSSQYFVPLAPCWGGSCVPEVCGSRPDQ